MYNEKEIKCKSCSKEDSTEKVNIQRFIDKMDRCFMSNDLEGAKECALFWEKDARAVNDKCGLLSILNEKIGLSRRLDDEEMAVTSIKEAIELLKENNQHNNPSGAVIMINIATTLNCFKRAEESIEIYDMAEKIYKDYNLLNTYEYAAYLNNRATAMSNLDRLDEAEELTKEAIEILKDEGKHDGEIAVSLINLAHILYDRDDEKAVPEVEKTLDLAWEYINSNRQPHDANYAYILSKCAPSLRYFNREMEARALEEISKEIYGE